MSTRTRRRFMAGLLIFSAAILLIGAASTQWVVHCKLWNGAVVSLKAGRIQWFSWDTNLFRIDYDAGISIEQYGFIFEPWPQVQLPTRTPRPYPIASQGQYLFAIPLWMIAAAAGGAFWYLRRRGWHLHTWQCPRCGYDLRGTAGEVCPECGRDSHRHSQA